MKKLKNTINKLESTDIGNYIQQQQKTYSFLVHTAFTKIDNILNKTQ